MNNIPTYKEFLNEGVPTEDMHVYEVTCRDPEGSLKKIIECIGACGNTGHSFTVVVDPDETEGLGQRKFGWDGDGSDYLHSVKTIQTPVKESLDINEADEVSVDSVLSSADKKKLKTAFETVVTGVDKLTFKKDGTIEGRRGYFYRHGQSPQSVAEQLKKALSSQGIEITIVDTYDDFKPWPKDSNFVVTFKLT